MGCGFNPWSGKTPHSMEQLSLDTTTTDPRSRAREPQLLSPGALEPVAHGGEQPPLTTTRESLSMATKTQHSQKEINKSLKSKRNEKSREMKEKMTCQSLSPTPNRDS